MSGRILLLGGTGLIGRALARRIGPERAIATHRENPAGDSIHFDSLTSSMEALLDRTGPLTHAVILFGESRTNVCAAEPEASRRINVDSTCRVLDSLRKAGVTPVFFSSDGVFDGRRGGYVETEPPAPLMQYGIQKLAVEQYMNENFDAYLVIRPARVYSARPGAGTMLDNWVTMIESGEEIPCATDNTFCPIDADDLAALVTGLMDQTASGVFHTGGPSAVTHHSLLDIFADALGLQIADLPVRLARIGEFSPHEERPLDTTMSSEKVCAATGLVPAAPAEICARYAAELNKGRDSMPSGVALGKR